MPHKAFMKKNYESNCKMHFFKKILMHDSEQLQKLWVKKKVLNLQWIALKWKGNQHLWFTKELSCFCINCSLDIEQSKKNHKNFSSQLSGKYLSVLSHI